MQTKGSDSLLAGFRRRFLPGGVPIVWQLWGNQNSNPHSTRRTRNNMVMHNPPHPGEVVREFCIKPLGLSVTEAAKGLGVSRSSLSELLNGRRGISPEMAIRLSAAFGGSAESWITQQAQYDLWQAMRGADKIKRQVLAFAWSTTGRRIVTGIEIIKRVTLRLGSSIILPFSYG